MASKEEGTEIPPATTDTSMTVTPVDITQVPRTTTTVNQSTDSSVTITPVSIANITNTVSGSTVTMGTPATTVISTIQGTPNISSSTNPNVITIASTTTTLTTTTTVTTTSLTTTIPSNVTKTNNTTSINSSNPVVILNKQRLQELVLEIDPKEQLDDDVEDMLLNIADDFIDNVVTSSCQLAKHRGAKTLEVKDVQLILEKNWSLLIPGFGSLHLTDELKQLYKKSPATEAHKQRMALIKKTLKKF